MRLPRKKTSKSEAASTPQYHHSRRLLELGYWSRNDHALYKYDMLSDDTHEISNFLKRHELNGFLGEGEALTLSPSRNGSEVGAHAFQIGRHAHRLFSHTGSRRTAVISPFLRELAWSSNGSEPATAKLPRSSVQATTSASHVDVVLQRIYDSRIQQRNSLATSLLTITFKFLKNIITSVISYAPYKTISGAHIKSGGIGILQMPP